MLPPSYIRLTVEAVAQEFDLTSKQLLQWKDRAYPLTTARRALFCILAMSGGGTQSTLANAVGNNRDRVAYLLITGREMMSTDKVFRERCKRVFDALQPQGPTALPEASGRRPIICIEFDGPVHAFSKGWHDGTIYDLPAVGAIDALRALVCTYHIVIQSWRDMSEVESWLQDHARTLAFVRLSGMADSNMRAGEFTPRQSNAIGLANFKPPCALYVDPRSFIFMNWPQLIKSTL